ncbi:MAG: hypothetical protein F9K27_07770 [Anaerolineae bacterium]|nr:MAG: hypothetical protein F9K27_07770 [Anaerolineae bacterium]
MAKPIGLLLFMMLAGFAGVTPGRAQEDVLPVVIALQELPRGFLLTEESVIGSSPVVGIALYPAAYVPAGAVQSLEEVVGKQVRLDVPFEQPISAYFLAPDLRQNPAAELPFPVSPPGYRVTQDRTDYVELVYDQPEKLRFPEEVAAGDTVMVITTTGLNDIWRDETQMLIPRVMVAQLTEDEIIFSAAPEDITRLNEYLGTGFPVTLAVYSPLDPAIPTSDLISWQVLTTRPVNPLVLPEGADVLNLRTLDL